MDNSYEESGLSPERLDDEELFSKECVKEDDDLMLVDCLLREAYRDSGK